MRADASPLMQLAIPPSTPVIAVAAPTTVPVAPPEVASEVKPLDALHRYVVEAMLSLPRAYVDRNEDSEIRTARMTTWGNEIASAVESSDLAENLRAPYAITIVFIGFRETLWARRIRDVGNEDLGLAHGYLQVHEWKGLDPAAMTTGLGLLRHAPAAWCLPSPRPWEGLPKAAKYLREHPFVPN